MINGKGNVSKMSGFAHLAEQANPKQIIQPEPIDAPEWPKDKCLKLRCILEGMDYYIPNAECDIDQTPPYFPFSFRVGYSVIREGLVTIVAINKHCDKRFFQTGITTEIVDLPEWWERRDEKQTL